MSFLILKKNNKSPVGERTRKPEFSFLQKSYTIYLIIHNAETLSTSIYSTAGKSNVENLVCVEKIRRHHLADSPRG
jgi:hypothetical protein